MSKLEAIYFPNLSLPKAKWLNPSLLYFDRIGTICPDNVPERFISASTRKLLQTPFVQAFHPHFDSSINSQTFLTKVIEEFARRRGEVKGPRAYELVHSGKISEPLFNVLLGQRLITAADNNFFNVPRWLALAIMTFWAIEIAYREPAAKNIVTNEERAWAVASKLFQVSQVGNRTDRRLRSVLSLLPVNENAPQDDILNFRREHESQLKEFRHYVEVLIHDERNDFENSLEKAQRCRDGIIDLLKKRRLQSAGPTIIIAVATTAAAIADRSPWSAAAATLPIVAGIASAVNEINAVKDAKKHPLAFAALAKSRFE